MRILPVCGRSNGNEVYGRKYVRGYVENLQMSCGCMVPAHITMDMEGDIHLKDTPHHNKQQKRS